jgi:tRNA(Ile)-lysidine synthase
VELGEGRGSVHFDAVTGEGLARAALESGDFCFMPRAGGERLRLEEAHHSRTLKNLLQEHALPAWERERLPLLFDDARLVWVPGVGIAAEYACGAGAPGLRPCWRVAGKPPVC